MKRGRQEHLANEGVALQGPRLSNNVLISHLVFLVLRLVSGNPNPPPSLPVLHLFLSVSKAFLATMALQLLQTTSHLSAFSGLRAAPSVPQVKNKLSRVGCVRRNSDLKPINSVMNPMDDPILKEAVKEPIAFLGGIFAGLLRLDLNEEPLKDWVAKTAEAAGFDLDESQGLDSDDSIPEDIRID